MSTNHDQRFAIAVDLTRCEGHGKCYLLAAELMQPFDDHGHAAFAGSAIDRADSATVRRAELVIASCPEQALAWIEVSGGDQT